MMNLQDFPNEILTKIFSQIAGDSALKLSTLSWFFYKLMRPIIYQRKITICFGHPDINTRFSRLLQRLGWNPQIASPSSLLLQSVQESPAASRISLLQRILKEYPDPAVRCSLLLRSLKENPDIAPLIVEVEFEWEEVLEEGSCVEMANQLLEALPNLKTLAIQAQKAQQAQNIINFQPQFLEVNPMLMLKDVTLYDIQLTMKTVKKYLSLPHLEKLSIGSRLDGTCEDVDNTLQDSSLRMLSLDMGYHISAEKVSAIFKSHSKITSFCGNLFGTEKFRSEYYHASGYMESLLSPVAISDTMAPLQNSLEQLVLQLCGCQWIDRGHDGTRMDLSMMNNLRILQCPSKCFFPPPVGGRLAPSRAGLYELLPPNLEELTLQFEQTQMLFEEPRSIDLESKCAGISRQLLWLAELTSNKTEYTPSLKLIVLDDPVKTRTSLVRRRRDPTTLGLRQRWRAPGAVGEGLAAAGITLRAEVDRKSIERVFGDGV